MRTRKYKPIEPPAEIGRADKSDQSALEMHFDELVRQGKAHRGTGTFPPDFFTRPLPKAKASVLEQLLEDRRNGR
jgi:hypothetical protein